ncbi:uncharacterized protein [Narcine bancroftii]|uniref:uncharacterized protein isoform X2 n=1 Tax=Narcine bancroftii TaxID=1343680 RepID=UPI0038319967
MLEEPAGQMMNGLLMGLISVIGLALLLIASTYITTSFVTSRNLWVSNKEKRSLDESAWSFSRFPREAMIGNTFNKIFYPLSCNPYASKLKACTLEDELNKTMCLIMGCCFKERCRDPCFHKTVNGTKQIMNILGIGILLILFAACCPFICCLVMQKTKLNPLVLKNKAVEKAKTKDMEVGAYILSLLKAQKRKKQALAKGCFLMPAMSSTNLLLEQFCTFQNNV